MNIGIFFLVCCFFYLIFIEIEYIVRIEKKFLIKGKCMYIEYVFVIKCIYFNIM